MKFLENANFETLGEILSTKEDNLDGRIEARVESYRFVRLISAPYFTGVLVCLKIRIPR